MIASALLRSWRLSKSARWPHLGSRGGNNRPDSTTFASPLFHDDNMTLRRPEYYINSAVNSLGLKESYSWLLCRTMGCSSLRTWARSRFSKLAWPVVQTGSIRLRPEPVTGADDLLDPFRDNGAIGAFWPAVNKCRQGGTYLLIGANGLSSRVVALDFALPRSLAYWIAPRVLYFSR